MPISVCPVGEVEAALATVWGVLMDPSSYDEWWNARTARVEPPGNARPGQVIHASSGALGRRWPVVTRVLGVDEERHVLELRTSLPLGISVHNHIAVTSLASGRCRVTFG